MSPSELIRSNADGECMVGAPARQQRVTPMFSKSTRLEKALIRAFVSANVLLIVLCFFWFGLNWDEAQPSAWIVAAAILAGYIAADFVSGFVHWLNDTWFDEKVFLGRRIAIAREHHTHPQNILGYTFLEQATVGSAPSVVLIGPVAAFVSLSPISELSIFLMVVCLEVAVCLLFGTSLHNLGHRRGKFGLTRFAQRWKLVMSPEHHQLHHRGDHSIRYCTVNGWADYPLDQLNFWRWLEGVVQWVTGAIPRENDHQWRIRQQNGPPDVEQIPSSSE